jgi:glycosyltransferase involved in cell wall biosynthesis
MTDYKNANKITLQPLVSVLLPVYNGELYLREAIESILEQTYTNFELIIINDGSSDDSEGIILSFHDPRIRYYTQENQGLPATLNRGIGLSAGDIIARQDQDDVSLPLRFERQISFLKANPRCGMLGTWAEIWVDCIRTGRAHRHPSDNVSLQYSLLFNNPFVHSSVMIRREVFNRVGLYCNDSSRQPPEDYELWSRVSREFEVSNIPEIHLIYREVPKSMSRTGVNPFLDKLVNISAENLAWVTGRSCTDTAARDLAALVHGAMHLVSPRPSFTKIVYLLRCAVESVCRLAGKEDRSVEESAEVCLRSIRNKYLLHRFGGTLGKIIAVYDKFNPPRGK